MCVQDAATEKLSQASESFEKELHRAQRELAQTKRELVALQDEHKKTKKEVQSLQGALDDASSKKVRCFYLPRQRRRGRGNRIGPVCVCVCVHVCVCVCLSVIQRSQIHWSVCVDPSWQ